MNNLTLGEYGKRKFDAEAGPWRTPKPSAPRGEREGLGDHQGGGAEATRAPRDEGRANRLYTSDGKSPALTLLRPVCRPSPVAERPSRMGDLR